jgi:hypothetical protein
MNNLSSSLVTAPSPSSQAIEASSRWARQALNVSNSCKREAEKSRSSSKVVVPLREREEVECELTAVVACYNLGKLAEVSFPPFHLFLTIRSIDADGLLTRMVPTDEQRYDLGRAMVREK